MGLKKLKIFRFGIDRTGFDHFPPKIVTSFVPQFRFFFVSLNPKSPNVGCFQRKQRFPNKYSFHTFVHMDWMNRFLPHLKSACRRKPTLSKVVPRTFPPAIPKIPPSLFHCVALSGMPILKHRQWLLHLILALALASEQAADIAAAAASSPDSVPEPVEVVSAAKKPEDAIPVIEIRGEGKPMSAAQIRELEEASNSGPLDIKITKTWVPGVCPRKARRLDFVTFHYKGFSEAGKKFDQSYGREPNGIRIQLGVGMVMPGLDKGLRGMCDGELRKIEVPWRLSRKKKSKIWRFIPNDEHWLRFDVEMLQVEAWTLEGQFHWMDLNNDTRLTEQELVRLADRMRKEFGKHWPNEDIDSVLAARYYIKYFDIDGDGRVKMPEFKRVMERDMATMEEAAKARKRSKMEDGRKRDPGLAWILDFNNDGIVSVQEMESADQVFQGEPAVLPKFGDGKEEL